MRNEWVSESYFLEKERRINMYLNFRTLLTKSFFFLMIIFPFFGQAIEMPKIPASESPQWLNLLNLPPQIKQEFYKKLQERDVIDVIDETTNDCYGASRSAKGSFHEFLLKLISDLIDFYSEPDHDREIRVLEIGGGAGYTAADIALTIASKNLSGEKFPGRILVSEPTLAQYANLTIFNFLKDIVNKKSIKNLYGVSAQPFPLCLTNLKRNSVFYGNKFDVVSCVNVIHFPLKGAEEEEKDKFFSKLFDSVEKGGYVFLQAQAPEDSYQIREEDLKGNGGKVLDFINKHIDPTSPPISTWSYYEKWKDEKKYPGYCQISDFIFKPTNFPHVIDATTSLCFPQYCEGGNKNSSIEDLGEMADDPIFVRMFKRNATMNLFSAKQLEDTAKEFGMDVVISGYLSRRNGSLGIMPNQGGDIPKAPSDAFLIAQKPTNEQPIFKVGAQDLEAFFGTATP